jgi:hypothetical protein
LTSAAPTDPSNAVRSALVKYGITWRQIYDGKGMDSAVVSTYGIRSVPEVFLIDGDSGEILARDYLLRGEGLAPTLRAALRRKLEKATN